MIRSYLSHFLLLALIPVFAAVAHGQNADNRTMPDRSGDTSHPKPVRERLKKLQIEREKKEHSEMLERGDRALKLSEELQSSFSVNNELSVESREKLADLEKLLKKIRSDLGGGDEGNNVPATKEEDPQSPADAFKLLQSGTIRLVNELKKTTRFSISAAAIQTSNSVLKIVRFLRLRD